MELKRQRSEVREQKTDKNILFPFKVKCPVIAGESGYDIDSPVLISSTASKKDRLLGHNPLAAIYTIDSYYRSLKQ